MANGTPMSNAAAVSLKAVPDTDEGATARALIRAYARILDDALAHRCQECNRPDEAKVYAEIGPKLLAALVAVGAMPNARAAGGDNRGNAVSNTLDDLRARRERRQGAN